MGSSPSRHNNNAILAIILASYLMIILDVSIVITGLPKILADLHFSATDLSWVQSAYTLTFGGFLLLGARAGDILGRRRMYIIGLAIFTLTSLAIGMSPTAQWMLVARAIQGIGAAILAPSTLALLATNFKEGHERTRAVAYYGSVAGIGASVGLVLGGILADWLSWRVGFFINVPFGIILMVAARYYLSETEKHTGEFDLTGAITSTLGMGGLVYGIVRSATAGWTNTYTMMSLGFGVILLIIFVLNEWKAKQPIMPLRLFASKERSGAYLARLLFLGGMVGFFFFITQYLQSVKGFSPFAAGVAFLPMTLVNFITALLVPRLTRQLGNSRLLSLGLGTTYIGLLCLSFVTADTSYTTGIALPMILIGIGQGLAFSPLTVSGVAGVDAKDSGAASGVVNVAHQMGSSLGLGILVVVFETAGNTVNPLMTAHDILAHRIADTMTAGATMMVLSFIVAIFCVRRRFAAH